MGRERVLRTPFDQLLAPQSIAVVGASERPDAIGTRVIRNLQLMGYKGRIYPVNPKYGELAGLKCCPSLSDLPEIVDAAFLAVPAAAGPDLLDEAGRKGIRAAFINANGYADGDAEGVTRQRQIQQIAKQYGIAISGPNNIGLINVHDQCAVWTPRYMEKIQPGPVAAICQSGSIALALSADERKLGLAYLISTGNEATASVAEYLDHIVRDSRVSVVLLFLETIRNPSLFAKAAAEGRARGKHIIALKLGSSEGGRALVQAHTGSLAGEDSLYDAYFRDLGIIRVRDLDEMLETAALLAIDPKMPPAPGFVAVTLSGGEAALIADLANEMGIKFPALPAETLTRLRPAFPSYSSIGNPLDAWGLGFNEERFKTVLQALVDTPSIGTIGFAVDAPGKGGVDVPYACVMARACAAMKRDKRLLFFNNTSGTGPNSEVREILDRAGIAYLSGMRPALAATANLLRLGVPRACAPAPADAGPALPVHETAIFERLSAAGVPMISACTVKTAEDSIAAAKRFGGPIVLKGVAAHLPHKSDLGLVRLGLRNAAEITEAFDALSTTLRAHAKDGATGQIVAQAMAGEGVELILGVRNEPGFGSFLLVGLGGVLVEVSREVSVRVAPVDVATARAMLEETAAGTLLAGFRGKGPFDIEVAASAIAAFSVFGAAQSGRLAALEINPLIVTANGAFGVDALFEAHASQPEDAS
jgi:acyl-CoA synthetase (NDP forming)